MSSAFPRSRSPYNEDAQDGMDLRDYFAAKAMQSSLDAFLPGDTYSPKFTEIATVAYGMANAMMKARGLYENN